MLRETGAEPLLTVADPTQKVQTLGVVLNGKKLTFPLPREIQAGQSTRN